MFTPLVLLAASLLAAPANAGKARLGTGDQARVEALHRRLAAAEAQLQGAEADRAQAEQDRRVAEQQRQQALDELAAIRQELAAARQDRERAARAREQVANELLATADQLRELDATLATGTVGNAPAVLGRAAQAFDDAHLPAGLAAVQAAQDALSRSDLAQARLDVEVAIRAAERAPPAP